MADLKRLAIPLILILALFAGGVLAGHFLFPRIQIIQVDRKIIEAVPVPGETKIVTFPVPGPVQRVEVPVEVTRYVDRPGKERIVTVTQPVQVPVEVVKREWPQVITVRVGSVLSNRGEWVIPSFQDLVIGQVAAGVYAVPQQEGWRLESVTTETRVPTVTLRPRWHVELRPTVAVVSLGGSVALVAGATVEVSRGHLVVSIAGGQSTAGPWGLGFVSYRF